MELEDIVKMGQKTLMPPPQGNGLSNSITQSLIGDYSAVYQHTSATPMRTPMEENIILQEVRNARALREMTPFAASEDENMVLPQLYEGTGFGGITPRSSKIATPNVLLNNNPNQTPMIGGGDKHSHAQSSQLRITSGTPMSTMSGHGVNSTPMSMGYRDQFGLNEFNATPSTSLLNSKVASGSSDFSHGDDETMSISTDTTNMRLSEKIRNKLRKSQIANQLSSLPEPEYTYDVFIPDVATDDNDTDVMKSKPLDAADVRLEQERKTQIEMELEKKRRSTVLQRNLPRPMAVNETLSKSSLHHQLNGMKYDDTLHLASGLIGKEVIAMLSHDEHAYPDPSTLAKKRLTKSTQAKDFDMLPDDYMETARELLSREVMSLQSELYENGVPAITSTDFGNVWENVFKEKMFVQDSTSGTGRYIETSTSQKSEVIYSTLSLFTY
jgi:pre-mRNA-splicing factor CDC5/CEF1